MILADTGDSLEAFTDGIATTTEPIYYVKFIDISTSDFGVSGAGQSSGSLTGATDATILSAPAAATHRHVKVINIFNADTVAHDITVQLDDATVERLLIKASVSPGKTLFWSEEAGWGIQPTLGGSGVSDFISLTDTPTTYVGSGLKYLRVNAGETALEFDALTTADVTEGTNLYFTDERVDDRVAALILNGTGITWTYDDVANTLTGNVTITQYTDELAQDAIAALIQNGTGLTWTYNDVANTLTGVVSLAPFSTTNLAEGTNLYYTQARFDTAFSGKSTTNLSEGTSLYFTDERAQDSIGAMVDASLVYVDVTPLLSRAALTGDVTAPQGSNATTIAANAVTTSKIIDDAVTYAKMQNVSATDKVLGRSTAGAGDVEEITMTAAGRALMEDVDAGAQRTTLGLGVAATKDYQSGVWTPVITFATPGDLSVTYIQQQGSFFVLGDWVYIQCHVQFTLTYTTASGGFQISGHPFPIVADIGGGLFDFYVLSQMFASNVTYSASVVDAISLAQVSTNKIVGFQTRTGGLSALQVTTANFPSGVTVNSIRFAGWYKK